MIEAGNKLASLAFGLAQNPHLPTSQQQDLHRWARIWDMSRIAQEQVQSQPLQRRATDHDTLLEDLYRWMARAHFERPADEVKAAEFGNRIKERLGR
jgi:hypothetical protein